MKIYNFYKVIYCYLSSLLKKYLRLFFTFFLLFGFNSVFSQVYDTLGQNKTWDYDTAKSYLFYKQIGTDFTICTSLDILKFKDDTGKEYGWDSTNPIPDEWDFEILTSIFDVLDCANCEWEDQCITYKGDGQEYISIYVKVINITTGVVIPGLDRVMISYKFTDDFTVTQYGFNSCLGTYDMKINEATIVDGSGDEIKVCNEYNF